MHEGFIHMCLISDRIHDGIVAMFLLHLNCAHLQADQWLLAQDIIFLGNVPVSKKILKDLTKGINPHF